MHTDKKQKETYRWIYTYRAYCCYSNYGCAHWYYGTAIYSICKKAKENVLRSNTLGLKKIVNTYSID